MSRLTWCWCHAVLRVQTAGQRWKKVHSFLLSRLAQGGACNAQSQMPSWMSARLQQY